MSKMQALWDRLPRVMPGVKEVPTSPVAGDGRLGKFIFLPCYVTGIVPYYSRNALAHRRVLVPMGISAIQREPDSVWVITSGRGAKETPFILPNGEPYEANPEIIEGIIEGKITEIVVNKDMKWLFGYTPDPSETVVELQA